MSFCGEWSLVKSEEGWLSATPLKCKCWACAECGPRRKAQLIAKAFAGKPTNFITLTCSTSHFPDPVAGAHAQSETWKLIVKRAKREAARQISQSPRPLGAKADWAKEENSKGQVPRQVTLVNAKLPYLAVFEATQNGLPHLHIIARVPWMSQKWLSLQMGEIMSSPVCWIKRVADDGRIAFYITKYVGKGSEKFGTLKRYWCTTNWEQPDEDEQDNALDQRIFYTVERVHIDELVDEWTREGWSPTFHRGRWSRDPPAHPGPGPPPALPGAYRVEGEKSVYYRF